MGKRDLEIIGRIVNELHSELRKELGNGEFPVRPYFQEPTKLRERVYDRAYQKINKLKPATLGRIAATGKGCYCEPVKPETGETGKYKDVGTSLFAMCESSWLDRCASGSALLKTIAAMTIVAALWDAVCSYAKEWKEAGLPAVSQCSLWK